jgi:Holliday junction resolvasome RuvABC endonuclease subunit
VRFLGIDPGVTGGMVCLEADGTVRAAVTMPPTEHDVYATLLELLEDEEAHAVLERVWSSPQMGVVSAFTFGRGYGALRMALTAAAVPFDEVTPPTWQTAMGCRSKGDKNLTKRRAQALFPGQTVTHRTADALLLAEFCRRMHGRKERTA